MTTEEPARGDRLPVAVTLALVTELVANVACARALGDGPVVGRAPFATFAGGLFVAVAALWMWRPGRLALPASAARWLGVLPAVAIALSVHVRGMLGPGPLFACGLVAALGALAMLVAAVLPGIDRRSPAGRATITVGAAVAGGLALRYFELTIVPIDPARGDMLPLVLLAGRKALAGQPPYGLYHFPWAVPLTYLPLGWLGYAPLFLTSFDPRWTSGACEIAVLGAVLFATRRPSQRAVRDASVALWAAWFVSSRLVAYDAYCASAPQWAALAWVAALASERNRWTPAVVGGALATTLLTVPLLPFVALAWYRARAGLLRATLVAAAVTAILVAPWFLWSPHDFVFGVVTWFNDLDVFPRAKWTENGAWSGQPGLTGLFWTVHQERLLKPLQLLALLILVASYARAARRSTTPARLAPALVTAMLLFLAFNPIIWIYLWEAAVVLALVAAATSLAPIAGDPSSASPVAPPSSPEPPPSSSP